MPAWRRTVIEALCVVLGTAFAAYPAEDAVFEDGLHCVNGGARDVFVGYVSARNLGGRIRVPSRIRLVWDGEEGGLRWMSWWWVFFFGGLCLGVCFEKKGEEGNNRTPYILQSDSVAPILMASVVRGCDDDGTKAAGESSAIFQVDISRFKKQTGTEFSAPQHARHYHQILAEQQMQSAWLAVTL